MPDGNTTHDEYCRVIGQLVLDFFATIRSQQARIDTLTRLAAGGRPGGDLGA